MSLSDGLFSDNDQRREWIDNDYIAEFESTDGGVYRVIRHSVRRELFNVYKNYECVQLDLFADDLIRYLCYVLHNTCHLVKMANSILKS